MGPVQRKECVESSSHASSQRCCRLCAQQNSKCLNVSRKTPLMANKCCLHMQPKTISHKKKTCKSPLILCLGMQNLRKRTLKWDGDTSDENCLDPAGGGGGGGVAGGEATESAPARIWPEKGPPRRETTKLIARTRSEVPKSELQSKKKQTRPQKKGR